MKKILLLTAIALPLLFGSCHNKANTPEDPATEEQAGNGSDNLYVSDLEADNTSGKPVEDLSGNVITLKSSEFIERVCDINNPKGFGFKGNTPCLVDFYAGWCGPCMKLKPIVKELAMEYKGELIVYTIDVDRAPDVCEAFGIEAIPTLIFFSRTKQPSKIVGSLSKAELKTAIDDYIQK